MSKVYYFHTSILEVTKLGLVPACTIAIKKDGDEFKYGVAICSKHDNFSRKLGREVAENRLNQGFGTMKMKKVSAEFNSLTENQQCLTQLYSLVVSVVKRNYKWKKKVARFNLENKLGANI